MKPNSNYEAYKKHLSKVADLGFAGSVLSWDQQTYMPKNGAQFRGQQLATLSSLSHEYFTDPKFGELLKELSEDTTLSEVEKANVRLTTKDYERKKKYPAAFVEEMSLLGSESFNAWHEARGKSDFKIYEPFLQRMIEMKRKEAEFIGYKNHPYEALLEDYEPGMTVAKIDETFEQVKKELFPFIKELTARAKPRADFLERNYPKAKQWAFASQMIQQMGYTFDNGRADDAPHPFCTTFGPGDVRITIRHDEHHFNMMFFAAVHEAGHGLYELGLPMKEQYGLPLGSALSLAFHESQSRFWENNVARSLPYWKGNFPSLQKEFPENLAKVSVDEFYKSVNLVEPSFIRVEADELTYHAHIYIRYLIEKSLLEGSIEVKDVPRVWNERYEEYLGIRPKNDAEGCLQDVHWAYGAIGYFPTYSFGSFYAAQLYAQLKKEHSNFDALIESGDLKPILTWLREKVHMTGRLHTSNELLKKVTGEELQVKYFMDYAREKYGKIYGL
ncbi:MAG: carboxypeptidase M32 [Bdellovibrionales bacterium]|nr:carboxypeptidase M32 [Oligoflexia bacterium]